MVDSIPQNEPKKETSYVLENIQKNEIATQAISTMFTIQVLEINWSQHKRGTGGFKMVSQLKRFFLTFRDMIPKNKGTFRGN